MNYNLQRLDDPQDTFADHFKLPLWNYIVPPRTVDDPPYIVELDFSTYPLNEFLAEYPVVDGTVLEIFCLRRRVQITAAQITVQSPVEGMVITPVMHSNTPFDSIACDTRKIETLTPFGGKLDRATNVEQHSVLIDDPDYFGIRIDTQATLLADLAIHVELSASDIYPWDARDNKEY